MALLLLQIQPVTVHYVMPFLAKANFCASGHSQLWGLCHVIQSDMLTVITLPPMFSPVHCSFSALHQLEWFSHSQQNPVPLQFPLPDMVTATDSMPTHWAFYFQGSSLPSSVSGSWSGSMCRAHIALQELQGIAMTLHKMAFCLAGKVVSLHFDNCTAKAYEVGTVAPFLSRMACWILSLTNKYSITLTAAYIPTHLNVEANYLSQVSCFQSGIFSLRWLKWLFIFGVYQGWICSHPPIPLNASIITPWKLHYLWGIGVEHLQLPLDVSGMQCVSSSCISSPSSVQVSSRTCQRSTQTFDSGGTMLDGGSLASHSSQHVGRHSWVLSHHKRSCCGCFASPCAQVSAISTFNPKAGQRCVLCQQGFSSSVCQAVVGST